MNRTWLAFWYSTVAGGLITVGIYVLTSNMRATIFLGIGITIVAYFVCAGVTSAANNLSEIRKLFDKK